MIWKMPVKGIVGGGFQYGLSETAKRQRHSRNCTGRCGRAHINLTEQACRDIGRGFALWLIERNQGRCGLRVAVGRDSRLSGEMLCSWISSAMVEAGLDVTDFGMASTPAMFMATVTEGYRYDGTVMITASHLPYNRNGFKFFTAQGGLESSDIREILAYAGGEKITGRPAGALHKGEFMDTYASILAGKIREATGEERPLEGFRIVVDAGNGAGGFYVDKVLRPLGADTTGSRFLEPDGSFPNHIPNPENETAMESILEWRCGKTRRISASSLIPMLIGPVRCWKTAASSTGTG